MTAADTWRKGVKPLDRSTAAGVDSERQTPYLQYSDTNLYYSQHFAEGFPLTNQLKTVCFIIRVSQTVFSCRKYERRSAAGIFLCITGYILAYGMLWKTETGK